MLWEKPDPKMNRANIGEVVKKTAFRPNVSQSGAPKLYHVSPYVSRLVAAYDGPKASPEL